MNTSKPKKMRIFQEEAKTRNTTHWDWDYLTEAQIEEWMANRHRARVARRRWIVLSTILGTALVFGIGFIGILIIGS